MGGGGGGYFIANDSIVNIKGSRLQIGASRKPCRPAQAYRTEANKPSKPQIPETYSFASLSTTLRSFRKSSRPLIIDFGLRDETPPNSDSDKV